MNSQRNVYANPLERAYAVIVHQKRWSGTYCMPIKGYAERVEDHLPTSIHKGASNLHSDEDLEDKVKLLDPRVQKLIRT